MAQFAGGGGGFFFQSSTSRWLTERVYGHPKGACVRDSKKNEGIGITYVLWEGVRLARGGEWGGKCGSKGNTEIMFQGRVYGHGCSRKGCPPLFIPPFGPPLVD